MALTKVIAAGIAPTGTFELTNVNTTGIITASSVNVGSAVTVNSSGLNVTGVITATSFVGDISQATGAAAGLGSALSQTQGNPLNQIYYVNNSLSITETVTINVPDSATLNSDGYRVAYTNYEEIIVDDTYDLIIANGDELQLDVLSLRGGF